MFRGNTVDSVEAAAKLKYYHADYGDWVYTTTPAAALARAEETRQLATLETDDVLKRLGLLSQAIQYEAVSVCLTILGDQVPAPPVQPISLSEHRSKRELERILSEAVVTFSDGDDELEPECETFTLLELTQKAIMPEFKRGDAVWTTTFDDAGEVDGYMPVTIIGLEIYPDEILYMIGHYDEVDGTVITNFERVEACDIFKEMPDSLDPSIKTKQRPTLRLVQ
jgi:hypothetical protein